MSDNRTNEQTVMIAYRKDGKTYLLAVPSDHAEWAEEMLNTDLAATIREAKAEVAEIAATSRGFWARVTVLDEKACWLWKGGRRGTGTQYGGWMKTTAHRYSWALANGGWPEPDQVVRHKCDVPLCVNPSHLLVGKQVENVADMIERGRAAWQGDECRNGHPKSPETTHIQPSGKQECLICRKEWWATRSRGRSKFKECPECGNTYRSNNLARHRRAVHKVEPATNPYRAAEIREKGEQ